MLMQKSLKPPLMARSYDPRATLIEKGTVRGVQPHRRNTGTKKVEM